jgi:radical SAM protein with 4Fe4S-binding SPASM domain
MCPAGVGGHFFPGFTKGLFFDRGLYRKALAEGAGFGLPSLRLGMTGEPLLLPDIDEWVSEAKGSGVLDISLISNGRLLTGDVSRRLIAAGLTRLMISVDAGGPEIYARVRPGGDWDILINNIREFLRIRREMGSALPLLRVSFVEMAVNQGDRENFLKIFEPLADYISFQRYLNILGGPDTEFGGGPADAGRYCAEPFTRLALHADGGLFPCCADFGRVKTLGNLKDGSLLAAWQSAEALSLTAAGAGEREPCRRCLAASRDVPA